MAARIRAGHRDRNLAITGVPPIPRCSASSTATAARSAAAVGRRALADARRRARRHGRATTSRSKSSKVTGPCDGVPVTGLVDDVLGLSAYMDIDALHRLMREGDVATGALLLDRPRAGGAAVGRAEDDARRRRRRLQARGAPELPRHRWPPT